MSKLKVGQIVHGLYFALKSNRNRAINGSCVCKCRIIDHGTGRRRTRLLNSVSLSCLTTVRRRLILTVRDLDPIIVVKRYITVVCCQLQFLKFLGLSLYLTINSHPWPSLTGFYRILQLCVSPFLHSLPQLLFLGCLIDVSAFFRNDWPVTTQSQELLRGLLLASRNCGKCLLTRLSRFIHGVSVASFLYKMVNFILLRLS